MNEDTFYAPGPDQTLEWIAVLCAAGLDYRLSHDAHGTWRLHVPSAQAAAAWREICAFENERLSPVPAPPAPAPSRGDRAPLWTAFWAAYALVLFYGWTGPYDGSLPVFQAGAAHAGRILDGQWWRLVTALTLHSGLPHLLGNAFFLLAIGQAVLAAFGRGTGMLLMLVGGIAGNALAALVSDPLQVSIGASTLCFAALGSMSTHQTLAAFRRWRRPRAIWKRIWLPMAAGVALLGMMGTGVQSDLAAHAFGFAAGAGLALPLCMTGPPPRPSGAEQWVMSGAAALIPLLAWMLALRS